ncbi:hypothetical protein Moror_17334 [Moniliophthora roreri MCA 2997]|uniref:Uncharacterized protein n=1 Tax=Moniliophthora roreri (strain MCA 2997) TaxID=1381753 RepID=V2Z1E1_MONRO|nr:hypothetical protein Moror_17334 [Moniliophthora roreri MCA 2997]
MLEVPAQGVGLTSSESTWASTGSDMESSMLGQLNGLEDVERRYTTEEKGKGKVIPQPLADMAEHNFTSDSADHGITEPCNDTTISSKCRGRPPKAKADEPSDGKKVRGRGRAKEDTDANLSGPRIKWKVVGQKKIENRPHAPGEKYSTERGLDEVDYRPRVWSSSKLELLSIFPGLSGKTCVNGISWNQSPVPIVLLDGGNGMAVSAMEDGQETIMEMTITRDFECFTTDMCDADGRLLSLPSIPNDILSSLLQSDPQHAPAPRRLSRKGNHGEAPITMTKGKDRAVTKARNVNVSPRKDMDINESIPVDVRASKHTSLLKDNTSERIVGSTELSRSQPQNLNQVSADLFQGVKDESGATPKDIVSPPKPTKSLRPRLGNKLSGSAAYSDTPIETSDLVASSGVSPCKKSDKTSKKKASQGRRDEERHKITISPGNALGQPRQRDTSESISSQSVKKDPVSPHLSAVDGTPNHSRANKRPRSKKTEPRSSEETIVARTSLRLQKRDPSTTVPKSDTKKRKLGSRTEVHPEAPDSASALTASRVISPEQRPRLPPALAPHIQTSDTHETLTRTIAIIPELPTATRGAVGYKSAPPLLSIDIPNSTFEKSKPLMSPGSPLTPLSPDDSVSPTSPAPSPKRRRTKGLPPTRHSDRIAASQAVTNTVVKLEHEEALAPLPHDNIKKRKRPGKDVGDPRLPPAPTDNAGQKRPSTLAQNRKGVDAEVKNESVSVAHRKLAANKRSEVLRTLKFQKSKSKISSSTPPLYESQKPRTTQLDQVLDHKHNSPLPPLESMDAPRWDSMAIDMARSPVQDLHNHDTGPNVESTSELVEVAKDKEKVLRKDCLNNSASPSQANKSAQGDQSAGHERELPSIQESVVFRKDSLDFVVESLSMELPTPSTGDYAHDAGPCSDSGLPALSIGPSPPLSVNKSIPEAPSTIPVGDYEPKDGIYDRQLAFQNYERNNHAVSSVCVTHGHQSSPGDMAANSVSLPIVETLNYKQKLCDADFSAIRRGAEAQTSTQLPAIPDNFTTLEKASLPFIPLSSQAEHASPDKSVLDDTQCATSKSGDKPVVCIPHPQVSSNIGATARSSPLAAVSAVVVQDGGSHSSLPIDPPVLLPGPSIANLTEVTTVVRSKAVNQEFESMKSQLRISFPAGVPEEVGVLNNALKDCTPIFPITTREIFGLHSKSWLPEEFAYLSLGFWQVVDVQRSRIGSEENSKLSLGSAHQPCHFAGRIRWSFRLRWVAGGEVNIGHTVKEVLGAPWWSPLKVSMSTLVSSMKRLSLSEVPAEVEADPVESFGLPCFISSSQLGFGNGDGGPVRGWYCCDCGKLNRQTFWRRQKCGSSFCKDKSITTCTIKSLDVVRERGQQQTVVFPINTHPHFVDPLVIEWDDGMKTLVYKLGEDLRITGNDKAHVNPVVKHIFTCNLSSLQEEHTKLFEEIQADVVLERQPSDLSKITFLSSATSKLPNISSGPYFTYAVTDSPDAFTLASSFGAEMIAWHKVPSCITKVRELLVHVSRSYGEIEISNVPGLLALAWTTDGRRKADSLLEAQQTPIIVMNLGCDVIINLLPNSIRRTAPITLASAPLPTPASSPVKREVVDDPPLVHINEIGGLLAFQPVTEEKSNLDADMQPVNDTLTSPENVKSSRVRLRHAQKMEPLKFTLVHGDALILSGDDFEYTIERGGTSILLLGILS